MCNDGHESRPIAFLMHPRASTLPPSRYFKGWPRNSRYPYNCTSVSATISAVFFRANAEGIFVSVTEGTHPIREGKREREKKREREPRRGPFEPPSSILVHQARFSRLGTLRTSIDAEETRITAFISAIITACKTHERVFESTMNTRSRHEDIQFFLI